MPSLPSDCWIIVSELLAGENDLSAISRLNVSCSDIHHATLPTLYESVHLKSSRAVERAVLLKSPDSWRHVKYRKSTLTHGRARYLFLDEDSLPVPELLCRQQLFSSSGSVSFKFDILSLFPRLILLAVNDDVQEPHNLQVSVYRPISLTTFLKVCNGWTSELVDTINLFARYFSMSKSPCLKAFKLKPEPRSIVIAELKIATGAYISSPKDEHGIIPYELANRYCRSAIDIEDESKTVGIEETLRMILGCPGGQLGPTIPDIGGRASIISFNCSTSILDCITEAIGDLQAPPFFNCRIHVSGLTTRQAIKRHIIALADAHCNHWTHHLGPNGYPTGYAHEFMMVTSEAAPEDLTVAGSVGFEAILSLGWNDGTIQDNPDLDQDLYDPIHSSGFTASVWEVDGFGDEQDYGQAIWTLDTQWMLLQHWHLRGAGFEKLDVRVEREDAFGIMRRHKRSAPTLNRRESIGAYFT